MKQKGKVFIGTSGVVLSGAKITFPEAYRHSSRLHYYSSLFNSLEVNSTFYKVPQAKTLAKWSADVLNDFRFTIKLWRGITHAKGLQYDPKDIAAFMTAADSVGAKKGCLLIQFPASITVAYKDPVGEIIRQASAGNVSGFVWKVCVEFRHRSWYDDPDTYTLLSRYKASMVIHDMPKSKPPLENRALTVVYLRFHGPKGDYRGGYTDDFLKEYAEVIQDFSAQGKDVYVYFNNTIGTAFQDAQLLKRLVENDE